MSGTSMYKTKLCILYKKNGNCSRPNCSFAHGTAELRRPGEPSSFTGRRHNLDSDLRNNLGRQFSPEQRHSLDRNGGRRVQRFSGHENHRLFEERRDEDYGENRRYDERRDYAGGLNGKRIEVGGKHERNKFLGYNNVLEEQLRDVQLDINKLNDDKRRLEDCVERKAHEAEILTSKIQELKTHLDREKEECKRITSNTKKFVKEYNRFLRAQNDLKRSQARLQKLGAQLTTYLHGNEGNDRETDIDIVSDEEKNGRNLRTASDSQNELQNTSSLSRKRHYVDQYTTSEHVEDALIGRGEEDKVENMKRTSRSNMVPSKSFSGEESGGLDEDETINKSSSKEDNWKRRRFSSGTSSSYKVMSSASMAARAFDKAAEIEEENPKRAKGSPLISLPPPPPLRDTHFQGDEEDVDVDVIEKRKATDVDSV